MHNASEKVIMCFGDSLTWGWDPETRGRFPLHQRWTGILAHLLGPRYRVIEEGLNGRTTIWNDPIEGDKNGRRHLGFLLESHKPLDLVVLMLGTNNLKSRFGMSAFDIAHSAHSLANMIQYSGCGTGGSSPEVLLVAPPPLGQLSDWVEMMEGGLEKSKNLARHYRIFAKDNGYHFFNAGDVVKTSDLDGIHWEAGENQRFAQAVEPVIRSILG